MENIFWVIGLSSAVGCAVLAFILWKQRGYLGNEWRHLMADYQSGKNPRDGQKSRYQSAVTQTRGPGGGKRRKRQR